MAEATKTVGGGVSAPSGALIRGSHPRVPNDGDTSDIQSGPLRSREVTIPTASVLALRATPYEIIPAPGAGKVIHFIGAQLQVIYNSIAYTESGCNLGFKYTDGSGVQVNETVEATAFIDQAATMITNARAKLDAIVIGTGSINKALVLHNLGGGEIAAGNSPLKVKIFYCVHDAS